jgi:DNA primase
MVMDTAEAAKIYFDSYKLKPSLKTSCKTGIHICLSCEGFTFSKARKIAENICEEVDLLVPEITTTEVKEAIFNNNDELKVLLAQVKEQNVKLLNKDKTLEKRK